MKYFVRYKSYSDYKGLVEGFRVFNYFEDAKDEFDDINDNFDFDELGLYQTSQDIEGNPDFAKQVYYNGNYEAIKEIIC